MKKGDRVIVDGIAEYFFVSEVHIFSVTVSDVNGKVVGTFGNSIVRKAEVTE